MKKTLIAGLLIALAGTSAANATTITFDSLEQSGNGYQSMITYTESGFLLDSHGNFASAQQQTAGWYAGSASLFNNGGGATTTLTKVGGGAFALNEISLARVSTSYAPGATVSFTGNVNGGGTVFQSFVVGSALAFNNFSFTGFNNLNSVSWVQAAPYHQFDNIVLDGGTVPEPATLALFGLALAGFAVARRKA